MHEADERAAALARSQYGLFTHAQIIDVASPSLIKRRRRGRWETVETGLYRLPGHQETWESRLMAACLVSDGVVSHRSAAVLWGIEGFRRARPEICVDRACRFRRNWVRVHQSTQFDRRLGRTVRLGLPITGVSRTLLDLGAVVDYDRVLLAVDDARRKRLIEWPALFDALVRHARRGRDGVGVLRALLVDRYGEPVVPDSAFERMVQSLLVDHGLPEPALQHPVTDGTFRARIDLAYPSEKVAIELDGRRHITDAAFESDPVRRNRLTLLGWNVLHFTWRFYADQPLELVASVRAAYNAAKLRHSGSDSAP